MGDGTMQAKDEFVTPQKPRSRTADDSANPYDARLSRWAPVSPSATLWLSNRLIVKPTAPPRGAAFEAARLLEDVYAAHSDDPGFAVFEITSEATRAGYAAGRLIHEIGVPILRRFLEGVLVHVGGFSPRAVHAVLDDWRTYLPETIFVEEIDGGSESNSHVYGLRPLNEPERERLTELVRLRQEVMNAKRLGDWGEIYVRACFKRSGAYSRVTWKRRLGHAVAAPGTNRADMLVTETVTGKRWAISVRNRKKALEPRSEWIEECLEMAKTNKANPWIIPSFATPQAVMACVDQGIRCTPIGARVMPAEDELKRPMRPKIAELYPVIGGEPFVFMGKNRLLEAEPPLVGLLRSALVDCREGA